MRFFEKKICEKSPQQRDPPSNPHLPPLAAGSSALRPPFCYSRLLLQLCRVHFYSARWVLLPSK